MHITFFDKDGLITGNLNSDPQTIELNKEKNPQCIDGLWDSKTHYVKNNQALERPACPATLDGLTLRNLPVPCKIVINSTDYDVTEPTVDLEFDYPGVYKITVKAFPYLDGEFEIET